MLLRRGRRSRDRRAMVRRAWVCKAGCATELAGSAIEAELGSETERGKDGDKWNPSQDLQIPKSSSINAVAANKSSGENESLLRSIPRAFTVFSRLGPPYFRSASTITHHARMQLATWFCRSHRRRIPLARVREAEPDKSQTGGRGHALPHYNGSKSRCTLFPAPPIFSSSSSDPTMQTR